MGLSIRIRTVEKLLTNVSCLVKEENEMSSLIGKATSE